MKCQSWPCLFGAVIAFTVPACHAFSAPSVKPFLSRVGALSVKIHPLYAVDPEESSSDETDVEEEPIATTNSDGRYDVSKLVGSSEDGAGFNQTITTASGLQITELLVGKGGSVPLPGYIVGINAVVSVGDRVIYDTTTADEKPIAFKLGQRPFQNVICEGVEEGIKGMKVGGKRRLDVPKALAPPGVDLPPGVPLTYQVELTEVLSGYF
eukprot:scaffold19705_cov58-Attheya_sp.AAC.1